VVANAVVPGVLPRLVGLLLNRFDGQRARLARAAPGRRRRDRLPHHQSISLFRFDEILTQILVVLAMVVIVDTLCALLRRRIA
jgi:phosphonate transport system permease protein